MKKIITFFFVFFVFLLTLLLKGSFIGNAIGDTGYVGSETCKGCHEPYFLGYQRSVHGKKAIPGTPVNREGCESCHGPGGQHAEKGGGRGIAIFAFGRKAGATTRSAKCLACHQESRQLANWDVSRHKTTDVSCDNCHSIHKVGVEKNLLKVREPEACFTCHKSISAQTNKQSHHPIREGKMKCNDCHNPHGSFDIKMMLKADSVNELCYKCHADKRGPFVFEHPPVVENCLICHRVHGSNHSYLLDKKAPQLCQSCHNVDTHGQTYPFNKQDTFRGTAPFFKAGLVARSCRNCHTNIHGSNSDLFLR